MKSVSRDFLTGMVALAGLAGLASLLFIFGEVRNVFARTYEFQFRIDQAGGLRPTSDVAMQGVRIGTVISIANATNDAEHGVDVRVKVHGDAKIPRDFTLYLDKGFVGDAVLDLQIPQGSTLDPANLVHKDEVLPGTRQVNSLFRQVETAMAEPLRKIGAAADRIESLSARAEDFFQPRTIQDVAAGKPANLWSTVQRVDIALTQASTWLGDETLHADVREIAARTKVAIEDVQKTAASLRATADSLTATSKSVQDQVTTQGKNLTESAERITSAMTQTLGRIDQTAGEIQKVAVRINNGEGTLGQLARNPDLYRSLHDAAIRLDKALTELQTLVEKFKEEGIAVDL
ncbi:MAG: hypothetical protein GIKADHBN_02500 [Phycisphaerales bacterium]|nr:hypothetical protein [Phycisphaerales bacterium]